ncbi:MAG: ABC transporter permease [Dehalococcoidales bacterium]|nr:ABC transporter permease [Dehalococcoidales bacterium]
MSLKLIGVLLGKEFLHGSRGYILILAIVMPLVLSLLLNLIFGSLFSEKAKLGIVDEGNSQVVLLLEEAGSLTVTIYGDDAALRSGVESGAVDLGVVLPEGFDSSITGNTAIDLTGYIWGESLAKNRITIGVAITDTVRDLAGLKSPVSINSVTLGGEAGIPWNDRMLPLIVIMSIFLGGLMLPATSIITEKARKTMNALLVTPVSLGDVFVSKGIMGLAIALCMGILILVINQAFGTHPLLLTLVLALGGVMAVVFGLILGIFLKDFATLFAVWKSGGIILFAPVLVYLFPAIPGWVSNIFPTHYIVQPIVDISQSGAGWPDVATNVFVLIGLDVALTGILIAILRKTRQFAT